MTDEIEYTVADLEKLALSEAERWRAGMAQDPPNPPMEILHSTIHMNQWFPQMIGHTDIFRDLVGMCRSDHADDGWAIRYLLVKLLKFTDFDSQYPRLTAQKTDYALLTKLWIACTETLVQHVPCDSNTTQIIMHLCPYISADWEPSLLLLAGRLADALVASVSVHGGKQKNVDRSLHTMTTLLGVLLEHTKLPDARRLCFEKGVFDAVAKYCAWPGFGVMRMRYQWLTEYAPLFKSQFYYNLQQLATALRHLDLPVLQLLAITDAVLVNDQPMHVKWRVLAYIKHFRLSQ